MKIILFATVLCSGLVAGLFYAYSCSVNLGLRMLSDAEYIKAMQSINAAIQNPVFFSSFMGLLILFPISAFQNYQQQSNALILLILAMAIYYVGVFGVTILANVPLNRQLAKFSVLQASAVELSAMRNAFEKPWNAWHTVRTIASIMSFALLIAFIIKQKN